jgi:hypothetical protein
MNKNRQTELTAVQEEQPKSTVLQVIINSKKGLIDVIGDNEIRVHMLTKNETACEIQINGRSFKNVIRRGEGEYLPFLILSCQITRIPLVPYSEVMLKIKTLK